MSLFKQELEEYLTSWVNNPNPESDSQEVCPLISSVTLDALEQKYCDSLLMIVQQNDRLKSYKLSNTQNWAVFGAHQIVFG